MLGASEDPDAAGAVLDESQFPVDPAAVQLGFSRGQPEDQRPDVPAGGLTVRTCRATRPLPLQDGELVAHRDLCGLPRLPTPGEL
jgi:hypothetical protein